MTRIKQICFVDEMNCQRCFPVGEPFYRNRVTDEKDIEHVRRMFTGAIEEKYELEVSVYIKVQKKDLEKAEELWMDTAKTEDMHRRLKTLNRRELEIVWLLLKGLERKEIAAALNMTEEAYKWNCKNLYRKLDVHNKYEIIINALKEKWLKD